VVYITSEEEANKVLVNVTSGVVGFDTEFCRKIYSGDLAVINDVPMFSQSAKRTARIALQYIEAQKPDFKIDWNTVSLCLVQIAFGDAVWILDLNRIRG
jgi:hypothetical protein